MQRPSQNTLSPRLKAGVLLPVPVTLDETRSPSTSLWFLLSVSSWGKELHSLMSCPTAYAASPPKSVGQFSGLMVNWPGPTQCTFEIQPKSLIVRKCSVYSQVRIYFKTISLCIKIYLQRNNPRCVFQRSMRKGTFWWHSKSISRVVTCIWKMPAAHSDPPPSQTDGNTALSPYGANLREGGGSTWYQFPHTLVP